MFAFHPDFARASHSIMAIYRRRFFIFAFLVLLLLLYLSRRVSFDPRTSCPPRLTTVSTDDQSVVNANPRILCWFPTNVKRLDRALVIYQ